MPWMPYFCVHLQSSLTNTKEHHSYWNCVSSEAQQVVNLVVKSRRLRNARISKAHSGCVHEGVSRGRLNMRTMYDLKNDLSHGRIPKFNRLLGSRGTVECGLYLEKVNPRGYSLESVPWPWLLLLLLPGCHKVRLCSTIPSLPWYFALSQAQCNVTGDHGRRLWSHEPEWILPPVKVSPKYLSARKSLTHTKMWMNFQCHLSPNHKTQ